MRRHFNAVLAVFAALAFSGSAWAAPSSPWTTSSAPALTASQAWESDANATGVGEPSVLRVGGLYRMWYSSGWDVCATGYATSVDGIHWAKYAGNPVLGRGAAGVPQACRNSVTYRAGVYYMFFSDQTGQLGSSTRLATSTDGANWTVSSAPILVPGSWDTAIQNTAVFYRHGRWQMIYDSLSAFSWQMGMAHASSPLGPWVRDTPDAPLMGFSRGGITGGPTIVNTPRGWRLFYQGSTNGADLPNDMYESRTRDFTTWANIAKPVVVRPAATSNDQVSDSSAVCLPNGALRLYYTQVDNTAHSADIRFVEQRHGCQ